MVDIPEGKWLQALELLPGNPKVLHHVVTYLGPFGMSDGGENELSNAGVNRVLFLNDEARVPAGMAEAPSIGGLWVAGSPPYEFAEGTGHALKTKQRVSFNMHYHPSGDAGTDASKVGLYFGEGEMKKEILTAFAADPGILIPAGAENHKEQAIYLFAEDSEILSLLPHMHNRGKSMRYTLVKPDGEHEVLLDVPEYDYDWQNIYQLAEPVLAPAGSYLLAEAAWDNSAHNPANPDPTKEISWGDGTNYEMLVAFIDLVSVKNKKPKAIPTSNYIGQLLERHEPESAYRITVERMGFGGTWGLSLPDEGDGAFYVSLGPLMFSTSIDNVERMGDEYVFTGSMITSAGGTRMPLGFIAKKGEDGTIAGELFFNKEMTLEGAEQLRGSGRKFSGRNLAG